MPKCIECGDEFYPTASGWDACGDCLASKIELALLRELQLGPRKPMRRAPTGNVDENAAEHADKPGRKIA